MNGELIIENYITEDDSFEDFYKKNRSRIKEALKGKKMKKRHLYNAKKLLGAIFLIPEAEQKRLILDAIKDTVTDTNEEGFEGGEFDHFGFAKKLRQRADRFVKKKVDLLSLKNLRNRLFHKNQPTTQTETTTTTQSTPGLRMRATEAKAQVIANNSKLAAPTVTTPAGGGSSGGGGDSGGDAGDQGGEGSGDDKNKTTQDQGGGDDKTKTTEDQQKDKKTADAKKAADDKSKETNKDDKGTGDDKNKKTSKKWLFIGGGTAVLVILIIVVIALSKGSATTVITK